MAATSISLTITTTNSASRTTLQRRARPANNARSATKHQLLLVKSKLSQVEELEISTTTKPSSLTQWARTNPTVKTNTRAKKYVPLKSNLRPVKERETSQTTFDFESYTQEKVTLINEALDKAVPLKEPQEIFDPMRYSLLFSGGKRIRPMVILATCELVGGSEEMAMPCACAMEMIHIMSLVNDDLPAMDNHDLRRGREACHKAFSEGQAIVACTGLLAQAIHHFVTHTNGLIPSEKIVSIVDEMAHGSGPEALLAGQLVDTLSPPRTMSELDWLERLHMLKTVVIMEKCVVVGAIAGGANDEEVERLRVFGRLVGRLFGFMDDILDAEEDALVADKRTYPKALGLEKAREIADKLRGEAQDMLRGFGYDEEKAAVLSVLIDFTAYRDY